MTHAERTGRGTSYQYLDATRIVATAEQLERRVTERFEGSSLGRLSAELCQVAAHAQEVAEWLARPLWPVRWAVGACGLFLISVVVLAVRSARLRLGGDDFFQFAQGVEAATNDVIFVALAGWFLLGVERRVKRRRAQKALHVLRSLAHVVDMHQLTKDPDGVGRPADADTASSPERTLNAFELTRYLDYSSELLALISKIAALYVQDFDDPDTLKTAGDVEDLTVGLSRNIWQKIMILDRITTPR